jgi:hypothetical protein
MLVVGVIWMSDFGDDFEEFLNEALNVLKGMI